MAFTLLAIGVQAQVVVETDTLQSQKIEEVVVTHQRQLVKNDIDKLTYDVQHDKNAKSKNTLEMLRKVPLVTVDGQDNIKVKGSGNFKIYKNGHPDPSLSGSNAKDVLKAIPASTIKKIEVITDPGAKYDAEGTSAILNIVLMDNSHLKGIAGTLNAEATTKGKTSIGSYLTTQIGKFALAFNFDYNHQSRKGTEFTNENAYDYVKSGERSMSISHESVMGNVHIGDLSASYDIDSLNLISVSVDGFSYSVGMNGWGEQKRWDKMDNLLYRYNDRTSSPTYMYYDLGGRADYQHKTHLDGEVLTLSYMLATTRLHNVQRFEYSDMVNMPVDYTGYEQNGREKFAEHTFQLDYVRPFGKLHKIESGLKYILRKNNSFSLMDYQGATADVESNFKHTNKVGAAYLSYVFTKDKWSARAGLRYEHSYMNAEFPDESNKGFHHHLNDWVPSASAQYKIADNQTIKLGYSMSIQRPGISYLNPALISTPTTLHFGNPALSSSKNHLLQLNYMFMSPKLTFNISPFYVFSNDEITSLNYVEAGKDVSTYGNSLRRKAFGVSTYLQWQPFKGTDISLNATESYVHREIPTPHLKNCGWNGMAFLTIQQQLMWKIMLNIEAGGAFGKAVNDIYYYSEGWKYYGLSLTRQFFNDKLSVTLNTYMPFTKQETSTIRTIQGDYTGYGKNISKPSHFGIRLTWNFGKLNSSVKRTERTISNDDLIGGIKK